MPSSNKCAVSKKDIKLMIIILYLDFQVCIVVRKMPFPKQLFNSLYFFQGLLINIPSQFSEQNLCLYSNTKCVYVSVYIHLYKFISAYIMANEQRKDNKLRLKPSPQTAMRQGIFAVHYCILNVTWIIRFFFLHPSLSHVHTGIQTYMTTPGFQ